MSRITKNKKRINPRYHLKERISASFDLVPDPNTGMDGLAYYINGASGNIRGRQSLLIAIDGVAEKLAGRWEQGPTLDQAAQNAAYMWASHIKREHGVEVDPEEFKQALMSGDAYIRKHEPPRDTTVTAPADDEGGSWSHSMLGKLNEKLKQPTTKTLIEGLRKYSKGEE